MPFLRGHKKMGNCGAPKGIHNSIKTEFKKGTIPWISGKHHKKETIENMRLLKIGRPGKTKGMHWKIKDTSNMNKDKIGKKLSEEHRKKLSNIQKGRKYPYKPHPKMKGKTPWNKNKHIRLNDALKKWWLGGGVIWNKGKKFPEISGQNHHNWNGGSSFFPYSTDWTKTLRRSIRERDNYICLVCGKEPSIDVHHIDYDKKNCNPDNLITLCRSCHMKTNKKIKRNYWINYFKKYGKK
jgi:hypothetical protein